MDKNPFDRQFWRKHSFIPAKDSYSVIRHYIELRRKLNNGRQTLISKIPMNLRLIKLSHYQKSVIMMIATFWATVEYLENYS